jgi:glycosyltransferase involved in cell wall biosynthesis
MKGFAEPEVRASLLGRLSAVVCVSGFIRDRVLSGIVGSRLHDRVHVVLNGIDAKGIAMIPPEKKRREIVFAGRLTPEKGSSLFVEAAARVLPGFPEWRGVLIGTRDPRRRRRITAFERNVIDRFNMLGGQGEVTGYLTHDRVMDRFRNAAIAVVPSLWDEPCGMVAIEAMASGCAVVTTPRGGLPEVLGDAGIMLESETSDALVQAFLALICDDSWRNELQRRARGRAVEKLDIRRACAQMDELRGRLIAATSEA